MPSSVRTLHHHPTSFQQYLRFWHQHNPFTSAHPNTQSYTCSRARYTPIDMEDYILSPSKTHRVRYLYYSIDYIYLLFSQAIQFCQFLTFISYLTFKIHFEVLLKFMFDDWYVIPVVNMNIACMYLIVANSVSRPSILITYKNMPGSSSSWTGTRLILLWHYRLAIFYSTVGHTLMVHYYLLVMLLTRP